jgi:Na+-transporting NADH:ubiquinone oxidoreductase subunit A
MPAHTIRKGLDLPIAGEPTQSIDETPIRTTRVAIVADDYPGMKPRMFVNEGDTVKRGQPLFEDRKTPGVLYTAPGAGRVIGVNRGKKRALQSVVIHLSEAERNGEPAADEVATFGSFTGKPPADLSREELVSLLVESGLWTALRKRPFSKVPPPESKPFALFVNAMDTNPLAGRPELVVEERREDFDAGLQALSKLTDGETHLCVAPGSPLGKGWSAAVTEKVTTQEFAGPHPAGTTGVHIHLIAPVNRNRECWSIGYQDVLQVGNLVRTGELDVRRVVAIGGPPVNNPRLVRTRLGAALDELVPHDDVTDGLTPDDYRLISGSVLSGKRVSDGVFSYLGRYHAQVSVLREGREREFLGWLAPGTDKFSVIPTFISKLTGGGKKFAFTTSTHGSPRAMVPIGMYEKVMPMDILPTFLLRALIVGDLERAEQLGCLELDEEDVALCTFVDPGKTNYGPILRANLDTIEKEG